MDAADYAAMVQRLIDDFDKNPKNYATPDMLAKYLLPLPEFDADNHRVMLEAHAHLKITPAQFERAMARRAKALAREAKEQAAEEAKQAWREMVAEEIGAPATDARSFMANYMAAQNVEVRYDMDCRVNGVLTPASEVENAAILTAEKLRLTLGNAKVTTIGTLRLAFEEYIGKARAVRKQAVLENILAPPDDPHVIQKFRDRICNHMFVDPELGCRAIMKVIWQTKRRQLGLYVELLQMIVLYGAQQSGKSELLRNLFQSVLGEVAAECDMAEVNDDKNFQLRSNALLFVDEMASTERADLSKIKNLITALNYSARIHYSHSSQKMPLSLTLIGTCDKRLNTLIRDVAGMRRFVEVDVRHRSLQTGLRWMDDVVDFPWLDLWRAVDHTALDPLMSTLGDKVRAHQEDMRARTNVESWVEQFQEDGMVLNAKKAATETTVEFYSDKLYRDVFRPYETAFHPGSTPTSAIMWGRTLRTLIEQGLASAWDRRQVGHNVVYTYTRPHVTPMHGGNGSDIVLASIVNRAKRPSRQ